MLAEETLPTSAHSHRRTLQVSQKEPETRESVKEFIMALRKLSECCQFRGFCEEALRDCLVCGLQNDAIQRKLLAEEKLFLDKAFKIAISMELARQAVDLQKAVETRHATSIGKQTNTMRVTQRLPQKSQEGNRPNMEHRNHVSNQGIRHPGNRVEGVANLTTIRQFVIFVKRSVGNVKGRTYIESMHREYGQGSVSE